MSDRWVTGDQTRLPFPANPATFHDGGVPFLSKAFQTPVSEITRCEEVAGIRSSPRPAEHYRALLTAIARLAGTHRSGRLPAHRTDQFPLDLRAAAVGEPPPMTSERLSRRVARLAQFADTYPHLLPDNVRSRDYLDRLAIEAPGVLRQESSIWDLLTDSSDQIALSHWNADIDNAWFWTDADGELRCGLMDWGCVSGRQATLRWPSTGL